MDGEGACSYLCTKVKEKECGNYPGIKLMSYNMILWERVIEARIRKEMTIAEQQFGFMPGRSTTDAIFCLRMLLEKWTEG